MPRKRIEGYARGVPVYARGVRLDVETTVFLRNVEKLARLKNKKFYDKHKGLLRSAHIRLRLTGARGALVIVKRVLMEIGL